MNGFQGPGAPPPWAMGLQQGAPPQPVPSQPMGGFGIPAAAGAPGPDAVPAAGGPPQACLQPAPRPAVGVDSGAPSMVAPAVHPGAPPSQLFGLVVPGREVVTDFQPVGANKYACEIPNPSDIAEITFFLLPNTGLPDCGVALYCSVPPFEEWEVVGTVTRQRPSAVFRTAWSSKPEMRGVPVVRIGVSLESEDFARNLEGAVGQKDDRQRAFAVKVAENLYRFMESFARPVPGMGEALVVPTDVLDRWMKRFESKYQRDPSFVLKQ